MPLDQYFTGEHGDHVIIQGAVVDENEDDITVQVFPGMHLHVKKSDIAGGPHKVRDPILNRDHVHLTVRSDKDIDAKINPLLARLTLSNKGASGPWEPSPLWL